MGLSTSDIRDALRDWLTWATGLPGGKIIWSFQNAPEESGQMVIVNPTLSSQRIGQSENIIQTNGDIVTRSRRSIITQIDVYGPDAFLKASDAYDALSYPLVHKAFRSLCLSADYNSIIRDLTDKKAGRYEPRASFDVRISAVYDNTTLADDLGWFDKVEYSGTGGMLGYLPETTIPGA